MGERARQAKRMASLFCRESLRPPTFLPQCNGTYHSRVGVIFIAHKPGPHPCHGHGCHLLEGHPKESVILSANDMGKLYICFGAWV